MSDSTNPRSTDLTSIPSIESQLPAGVSLQDVLRALAAQPSTSSSGNNTSSLNTTQFTPPSAEEIEQNLFAPFDSTTLFHPDTTANKFKFRCLYCNDLILLPRAAVHDEKEIHLHHLHSADKETLVPSMNNWLVQGQMSFENVAVTRPMSSSGALVLTGDHKYLACSSCDRGPFGITYLSQPGFFYIAHGRVKYSEK